MTESSKAETTIRSTVSDHDWSQIRETVLMLKLAAAQAEFSMRDGNSSVDVLTAMFTGMASDIQAMETMVQELIAQHDLTGNQRDSMVGRCSRINDKMQQAIVAFQFYDKLVQRIDHVGHSLLELAELVGEPSRLCSPLEWQMLRQRIRAGYTMAQERELFDAMIQGEDVQTVLRLQDMSRKPPGDDIELF